MRYVVEGLDVTVQKATPGGRITRLEATLSLIEAPVGSLIGHFERLAQAIAPGVSLGAVNNPLIRGG
ncbi:hypothetical protein TRP8649_03299 [Pelagimonas phthalicica]|uniref:Uncharacterized protein n=1 Tax=Pelagimonas phthalicica TaxID=1037362 RepID=A0A238JH73_9RHOB|nr:hypothetical protein [Pelagimonas phthalicica]TDS92116.1 hypothetical protein CLV87_3299 [Pelagimonas phthalicica]SMX29166.1 hypothetical protein TRP8649_03299 [Pelagimonas phthalicica]